MPELLLGVSEFVAVFNQTIEYAYPKVSIIGELSNFRISKERWIYFDLIDEYSSIRFFGTISNLPGPLEDGLILKVVAKPRLHPQYGFSLTVVHIEASGEGSIKKANQLLKTKLTAEGLFENARKRILKYPPEKVGLITSAESAAFSDFVKIINERWSGLNIDFIDVPVQGEVASDQIINAIIQFNLSPVPPDVLVVIRGGGSIEDLQVFNNEHLTRALASSRIPTLVAIGHEKDISLAELAADQRASTPSNAAELLVPDKNHVLNQLKISKKLMYQLLISEINTTKKIIEERSINLNSYFKSVFNYSNNQTIARGNLLALLNPKALLKRGFIIVRKDGDIVRSVRDLSKDDIVEMTFKDGQARALIQ